MENLQAYIQLIKGARCVDTNMNCKCKDCVVDKVMHAVCRSGWHEAHPKRKAILLQYLQDNLSQEELLDYLL